MESGIDIKEMCENYKKRFSSDEDILNWIEHDLHHMGISNQQFDGLMNEAEKILRLN